MDNILRDEVNQHTSDEVAKVLADLEAQGVDLAAIKEALAGGGSSIKSIQRVSASLKSNNQNTTVSIKAVDTSKCFVIAENQLDPNVSYGYGYTLNSNNIYVWSESGYTKDMRIAFWIVEFN